MTGILVLYLLLAGACVGFQLVDRAPEPLLNVLASMLVLLTGSVLIAAVVVLGQAEPTDFWRRALGFTAALLAAAGSVGAYRVAIRNVERFTLSRD
jgi:H+-translocating NAD(P) transhydrogenase subunit alpha